MPKINFLFTENKSYYVDNSFTCLFCDGKIKRSDYKYMNYICINEKCKIKYYLYFNYEGNFSSYELTIDDINLFFPNTYISKNIFKLARIENDVQFYAPPITIPSFELDFFDKNKLYNKLKMYLIFS